MTALNNYTDRLYPLQDRFLRFFDRNNEGRFYLTGGTALSRIYFHHRYSEDLDFFSVHERSDFREITSEILKKASREGLDCEVETVSEHFLRVFLPEENTRLKIDFVNEMTFHWGDFHHHPLFSSVDNVLNILADKITCLNRYEVKDIVVIWAISRHLAFNWRDVFAAAEKKSPVDPVECSKIILSLPEEETKSVLWTDSIDISGLHADLGTIARDILFGKVNTLK